MFPRSGRRIAESAHTRKHQWICPVNKVFHSIVASEKDQHDGGRWEGRDLERTTEEVGVMS